MTNAGHGIIPAKGGESSKKRDLPTAPSDDARHQIK